MASLLIKGGRVLDPATGTDATADVAISGDRIAAIGPNLSGADADRVIDARDRLVTPGLIDPHVHLREPGFEHKETIATGAAAAVAGGFTTVCCMPNTDPPLDSPEVLQYVQDRAATALCRVYPVGCVTQGRKGERLADLSLMGDFGVVGFSDDGDAVANAWLMRRALVEVKRTGLCLMQHCQEPALTRGSVMHAGDIATRMGLTGWPAVAEQIIIERDIRLNRSIGCAYHVQHISSAESVEIVRRARAEGLPVTAEASPHHLLLTHEQCAGYNTNAKMNPPLREAPDAEAVRAGIADGTITVLATDHAPHSQEEKDLPFEQAPFGIIGLETALPLYVEALVTPGLIGWMRLIELMSLEPARLCRLEMLGLGKLVEGGPADVTVIDPDAAWTITEQDLAGKGRNTPFLGRRVRGRAVVTIVGGHVRFEQG